MVVLTLAAWQLDTEDDEVTRGVEVAGRPVGGLDRAELDEVLAELAEEYARTTVTVRTPEGDLTATGAEIGLALDVDATRAQVLGVGRDGPASKRFLEWVSALTDTRSSDVQATIDEARLAPIVVERDPTGRTLPTEPRIATDGEAGALGVVPGVDGSGLDPATVAATIVEGAQDGALPLVVSAEALPVPPRFTDADADAQVARGLELTAEPLVVQAGETVAEVPPETMRSWLRTVPVPDGLLLDSDRNVILADLQALLPDAGARPVDASFQVEGGRVVIVPGRNGTRCCTGEAAERVAAAVITRPEGPVALALAERPAARTVADAAALRIVEPIGSFTTNYQAGQSRVQNIHRISDLTRGVVIEPGGSFSVNGHVGRRTEANGFAPGGVIQDGVFEESVGGGISQYATTLFNAAFFGGLDFGPYQSHSIYISRYPYGREATLSFPQPDLVVENTTPNGVLVWPTYTATSVTVTLYSTRHATGEQTGQSESPVGECTRVKTDRTRTYVDGRTRVDAVYATYRPDEGVDC